LSSKTPVQILNLGITLVTQYHQLCHMVFYLFMIYLMMLSVAHYVAGVAS